MRLALITACRHGAPEVWEMLTAPGEPRLVNEEFKRLSEAPGDLAEVHFWDAHAGVTKRKKFTVPAVAETPAPGAQPGAESGLSDLTVAQLKERCEELGIDAAGFRVKADYISALELDDRLSELTIAQLKEKAAGVELDVTGLRRKRELLDALEEYERTKGDGPSLV